MGGGKMIEEKQKELDLEVLAGKVNWDRLKECDTKHYQAFDFHHPIRNFIQGLGIKDPDSLIEIVNEGIKIIPSEEQSNFAGKYLENWIKLIQDTKQGKKVELNYSICGKIEVKYNRQFVEERLQIFKKYVNTLCAIAQYNLDDTLKRMLE